MPSSGRSRSSACAGSVCEAARRASAASASARARSRSIDSQALRAWSSRSAAARCASVSSRDVISPRAQQPGHLVGEEARRVAHRPIVVVMARHAAQRSSRIDGTTMKSPSRAGALASTASTGSDGRDDVVAQDVLELDRLRGRRDVVGRKLGQDRVLVEDVVELGPRGGPAPRRSGRGGRDGRRARLRSGTGWPSPDDSRRASAGRLWPTRAPRPYACRSVPRPTMVRSGVHVTGPNGTAGSAPSGG